MAGRKGITDDVGEGEADGSICKEAGDGMIDGVGGCGIDTEEDDGGVEGRDDGEVDGGADGKAGGVEGLMCGADGIEFARVGA